MVFLTGKRQAKRCSHTRREGAEYAAINLCVHGDNFVYAEIYSRIYGNFPAYIQMFPSAYRAGSLQALGTPPHLLSRDKATGMRSLRTRLGTTAAYTARCSANDSIFAQ